MDSADVGHFQTLCGAIVAPAVAGYGFEPWFDNREKYGGGRYEQSVGLSRLRPGTHPRHLMVRLVTVPCPDGEDFEWVQILLGDGNDDALYADVDQGTASPRVRRAIEACVERGVDLTGYWIRTGDRLATALTSATVELLAHGDDLLTGDLSDFRGVRSPDDFGPWRHPAAMCGADGVALDEAGRRSLNQRLEALRREYR